MNVAPRRNRKLFLQLTALLTVISVSAAAFIYSIFLFSEGSSGKGSAINLSGSLRMQSYVMALAVASTDSQDYVERAGSINTAVEEFERRLLSPGLENGIPAEGYAPLRISYNNIKDDFYSEIRPLALEVIEYPERRDQFLKALPTFVKQVDTFVFDLEENLEHRVKLLKTGLVITILVSFLIGVIFLLYLSKVLFKPLHQLADIATEVRSGNFSIRSSYKQQNEIGELSDSFNYMIEDLSRLYNSLEEQVRIKTKDLDRKNAALKLLYDLRSEMTEKEFSRELLQNALNDITDYFGADDGAIILIRGKNAASMLAVRTPEKKNSAVDFITVNERFEQSEASENNGGHFDLDSDGKCSHIYFQPLKTADKIIGRLILTFSDKVPDSFDEELMESASAIITSSIEANEKTEENFRLALYEERSTIARELHDSIAQSLAYSKIQLTRLSYAITNKQNPEMVEAIIDDLKTGVSTAYQQLREVLTTFRIKPASTDFKQNVRSTVEEFHNRSSIAYTLDNELLGFELTANQQIHVLQILSEALSNVSKHSRATHVSVSLSVKAEQIIELLIEDNGVGFDLKHRNGHFGLQIMDERARALGGKISLATVKPHGTLIKLEFKAEH